MAVKTKNAKGFGARYGRKIREKIGRYNEIRNAKKKCPYCHAMKVKRVAFGIWNCRKCSKKFTGKAYELGEVIIKEEILEEKKEM
jgi:large subunit ribosomal protein L37Ae